MSVKEKINLIDKHILMNYDEQDTLLPVANVGKIMKQILPPNAKISKEAKATMQECATEFISFVTGEAADKCHKENRKILSGEDICWALGCLGLDHYYEVIMSYLHKYKTTEIQKPNRNKRKASCCTAHYPYDEPNQSDESSNQIEFKFIEH